MFAHVPPPDRDNQLHEWQVVNLDQLPLDLRRVLTVQFKEFIHRIEDVQQEHELPHNPRVLNFLERCYRRAA